MNEKLACLRGLTMFSNPTSSNYNFSRVIFGPVCLATFRDPSLETSLATIMFLRHYGVTGRVQCQFYQILLAKSSKKNSKFPLVNSIYVEKDIKFVNK